MHRPALAALALAVACASPPPAAAPGSPQDTSPPASASDDTAPPDTDDPGDTDSDEPEPQPQRFEHVCSGGASYVHTFPVQLAWGDTQPEIVRWLEHRDGGMTRSDSVYTDAVGNVLADCTWMPPSGGEPGHFFYPRHMLVVK